MDGGRLPIINGKRVIQALVSTGFVVNRVVGSHHVLVYPGDPTPKGERPCAAGPDLKPGTLRSIIRQAGLTVEGFTDLL
jgi:predicted RNA binding protein YcfA (HicA-like mRNA interferase family)